MTTKLKPGKCPHCKHDAHNAYDCSERVCDAAGDMDGCPCYMNSRNIPQQTPPKKKRIVLPESLRRQLKRFSADEIAGMFQIPIRMLPAHLFKQQTTRGRRTRSQGQTSKRTAGTRHPENTIETTNTHTNRSHTRYRGQEGVHSSMAEHLVTLSALSVPPVKPIVNAGLPVTGPCTPGLSTRLSSGQRRGRAVRRLRTGTLLRPRRLT